jgi:hypothetical protein
MTYAHTVFWLWCISLLATLVAFALAWRALFRVDAAVVALRSATDGLNELGTATEMLREASRDTERRRSTLHARAADVSV